jgi:hypothetical protein
MTRFAAWPLALAMLVSACGDSTEPVPTGTFEATVTGEFFEELSGRAQFGYFQGEGFGLVMTVEGSHWIGLGARAEARPPAGTYEIQVPSDEAPMFAAFMHFDPNSGLSAFTSISGEAEITRSTPELMEGSFIFTARGSLPGAPDFILQVTVEGTFSASCNRDGRCN